MFHFRGGFRPIIFLQILKKIPYILELLMRSVGRRDFQEYDSSARKHKKQRYVFFFLRRQIPNGAFSISFPRWDLHSSFFGVGNLELDEHCNYKICGCKGCFQTPFFSQKTQKSSFFVIFQSYFVGREFCETPEYKCKIDCTEKVNFHLLRRKQFLKSSKCSFYENDGGF